jgi:CHASE2 domain-containing sensor protein
MEREASQSARRELATALGSLWFPAIVLVVLGGIIGVTLVWLSDFPPMAAARDAVLNEHMTEQANGRPPPAVPGAVRLVAFDAQSCQGDGPSESECQPDGLIDRGKLAEVIRTAGAAQAAAILLDIAPRFLPDGCDEDTAALVMAISEVSLHTPVILPRALLGREDVRIDGQNLLDQCPETLTGDERLRLARGDGVFFGHVFLLPSKRAGVVDAVRPWIAVDMPASALDGAADQSVRRRIPAVSLVASLAMQEQDPGRLLELLQTSGLETRWHATPQAVDPAPLRYCRVQDRECRLEIAPVADQPPPWRINFHFGWHPDMPDDKYDILTPISVADFNAERADALAEMPDHAASVVIIAATMPGNGDLHYTPIGQLPGGAVHANALFAFALDGFLWPPSRGRALLHGLLELCLLTLQVLAATAVLTFLWVGARAWSARPASPRNVVHWTWPIALATVSAYHLFHNWERMHEDFDQGILSLSLIGVILALLELRSALEDGMTGLRPKIAKAVRGCLPIRWALSRFRLQPPSPFASGKQGTDP